MIASTIGMAKRWQPAMRSARVLSAIAALTACSPRPAPRSEESRPPPSLIVERSHDEAPPPREVVIGIRPGECPAAVGEFPSAYFDDRVLIRLPAGLSEDEFVELEPGFVRAFQLFESVDCRGHEPGPTVYFFAMMMLPEQPRPGRTLEDIRDELLDQTFEYPRDRVLVEQEPARDDAGVWVYEVPIMPTMRDPHPARVLIAMFVAHRQTFVVAFEVHSNAWPILVDTLMASALSLSVLAP